VALKVEVDFPDYPKGHEFDVSGILVPNGGSTELSEEAEQAFLARKGRSVKDAFKGSANVKVSGTSALNKKEGGDS
jgi:hypothetical protein